ncbi:MAG: serine hydrolase [Cytophagales bacterium]|nr:serine hydrolase [Cytophagales bacterium]
MTNWAVAQKPDERLAGLDQEIESLLKAYNAAGLSVAVVEKNKVLYSKGFGYRDYQKKLPVTPNTAFPIGSATKAFTAALLGMLAEHNKLALTDKPSKHLPGLRFYSDQMNQYVTLGDLLTHASGLGNVDGPAVMFPVNNRKVFLERLPHIKPSSGVRDRWEYSNLGYIIAGAVAESASGTTWEKNIEEKIFIPLGMESSTTSIADLLKGNDFSYGYGLAGKEVRKVLYRGMLDASPAGAVNSTANDLCKWVMAWLNEGKLRDAQVLPSGYVSQATSARVIDNGAPPPKDDPGTYLFCYGYGWFVASNKGHYRVMHGGNTSGFSTNVAMYPTDDLGIVVLTNQNNSLLPFVLTDLISNRMLNLDRTSWDKYPVKAGQVNHVYRKTAPAGSGKKPEHPLKAFTGTYQNPGYGQFDLILEKGALYAVFPAFRLRLRHLEGNAFQMQATEEVHQDINPEAFSLDFTTGGNGEITGVKIDLQSEPVVFSKN